MADTHHDEPDVPGLPTIQDEAADTPMWVPATGLALLAVMVLMLVYHVANGSPDTDGAAEADVAADVAGDADADADGDGAEVPAAEAEAADAPAADDHAGHGH